MGRVSAAPSEVMADEITLISASMTVLLVVLMALLATLLWKTTGRDKPLDWADLVTDVSKETGAQYLSLNKVGLLTGILVGSWCVVTIAYRDKLSWEILVAYFAFVGTVEGYAKYLRWKAGNGESK